MANGNTTSQGIPLRYTSPEGEQYFLVTKEEQVRDSHGEKDRLRSHGEGKTSAEALKDLERRHVAARKHMRKHGKW